MILLFLEPGKIQLSCQEEDNRIDSRPTFTRHQWLTHVVGEAGAKKKKDKEKAPAASSGAPVKVVIHLC